MTYLKPILYHAIAVTLLTRGIYHPTKRPYILLSLTTTLLCLALYETSRLPPTAGLNFFFGMLHIVTLLNSPFLVNADIDSKAQQVDSALSRLHLAYKIYNNPRMLPITKSHYRVPRPSLHLSSFLYAAMRKVVQSCAMEASVVALAGIVLGRCTADDFSADKERFLWRLLIGGMTLREVPVRLFVSFAWIAMSMSRLNLLHVVLSVFFVALLQLDRPEEWPPLFGSLGDAYSLQRFWANTWHKLATGASVKLARKGVAAVTILFPLPVTVQKSLVSFMVFTISGVSHAIVVRCAGEAAPMRDVYFFWACYVGVCLEIFISGAVRRSTSFILPQTWQKSWVIYIGSAKCFVLFNRAIGYIWVATFFFWLTPRFMYPKIRSELMKLEVFETGA